MAAVLRVIELVAAFGAALYLVLAVLSAWTKLRHRSKWLPVVFLGLWWAAPVYADPYYNSSESGCDGSNTNVYWCDDFEDGVWYATDCDTSGGWTHPPNDGWCGDVFANPITPANAIVSGVTPFGTYAGTAGTKNAESRNQALHRLKTPGCGSTGIERCGVQEVYVRWYAYWVSGYQFGAEKHMNITNGDGDIAFGNVQLNCGTGSASSTATISIQIIHGEGVCQLPNVEDITLQSGRWYFFELHMIAHATNGTVRLWVNDCGTAGTSCGASPVLRTLMTGVDLPGNGVGSAIETIWAESWANPQSTGTGPYWDNIKVAAVGPIGFTASGGSSGNTIVLILEWAVMLLTVSWHYRAPILAVASRVGSQAHLTARHVKHLTYHASLSGVQGLNTFLDKVRRR